MFAPAESWQNSNLQLNTLQILDLVAQKYPGLFDEEKLHHLLLEMHVIFSHNEHNGKYYWLLNLI